MDSRKSRPENKANRRKLKKHKGKCWRCQKLIAAKSRYEICLTCKRTDAYRFGEELHEFHRPN